MAEARKSTEFELNEVRIASDTERGGWPLSMPAATSSADAQALVAHEAQRWTYVLRSRRRWVNGSRARERNEQEARTALVGIGIDQSAFDDLSKSERIVVRIPYVGEEKHWESRIFPWEYVLAAATRDRRIQLGSGGHARALTVMRELQIQTPASRPMLDPKTLFADGLRVLFVECVPAELRELWSLDSEQARLRASLPEEATWHVLSFPTLVELRSVVAATKPQLIHFAGLDSHQGVRELRVNLGPQAKIDLGPPRMSTQGSPTLSDDEFRPLPSGLLLIDDVMADRRLMLDGVLLRGLSREQRSTRSEGSSERTSDKVSYPCLVRAQDLAVQLAASGHTAYLITFNLWNTAARVAPMMVAERAALASVGFQDAFDDALAEYVHAMLYTELISSSWNLPEAFRSTWLAVRKLPESVDATGITLWAGAPVLSPAGSALGTGAEVRNQAVKPKEARVTVEIEPFSELNYAVLHNAQPLFKKFVLDCDRPGDDVRVDVDVAVYMGAETARYRRQVTMSDPRVALTREIHVPLTADLTRKVREAISSSLSIEIKHGDRLLYSNTHRLRLLPVDQWRDNLRDGRWLPSFVQPRDPAIARALEQAQRYVRVLRDDPSAGFEGYQMADENDEESLRAVDRQVEAVWATLLHDWRLGYINPPPTYSGTLDSQRLRMPSTILEHRAGTCIDLALLFAACLELIDVYPVIFLLNGHALPGWWRHPKFRDEYFEMPAENFAEIEQSSASENTVANAQVVAWHTGKASWPEVRRWIRERKLVPIETVRLTEHCGFVEAIEAGVQALRDRKDFDSMLEIITARMEQVTPLPVLKEVP
jgi:hypothetical protein